jgi:hypothetical protein
MDPTIGRRDEFVANRTARVCLSCVVAVSGGDSVSRRE